MRSTKQEIGREDRRLCELIDGLNAMATPGALDLANRLTRCRASRIQRRGDVVSAMQWGYRCRTVACWSCAKSRIARKALRVMDAFSTAENDDCSLLTVCLSRTSDLELMSPIVRCARKAVRNLRDRYAAKDPYWNSVSLAGAVEIDSVASDDVMLLPPLRRELVSMLPMVGVAEGSTLWLPHMHLCVHHPDVDRDEIRDAFATRFLGNHRVDVTPFRHDPTDLAEGYTEAEINAYHTGNYAFAQDCNTSFTDPYDRGSSVREQWPIAWKAEYFVWLHETGRSLQSLQVVVGARKATLDVNDNIERSEKNIKENEEKRKTVFTVGNVNIGNEERFQAEIATL